MVDNRGSRLKPKTVIPAGGGILLLALALFILIPTTGIEPADGHGRLPLDSALKISPSPFSRLGKVSVTVNGSPVILEYNLGSGEFARELELGPGEEVRIEAKVTSPIGLTRDFTSTFTTVEPVLLEAVTVDGARLVPGQKIPPQPTLTFAFNKPVNRASVALDGGGAIELHINSDDSRTATLPPTVSLRQGEAHVFSVAAIAEDSATLPGPQEVRAMVVKPLTFYGTAETAPDGGVRVELSASAAFRDPEAVREALTTTLPGAAVTVARQKIVIAAGGLDASGNYTINLGRAEGADGSFLETPLTMTLSFRTEPSSSAPAGGSTYRGYVYTTSGSASGSSPAAGGAPVDSGPPPGWPSCCPWPPQ